ncbi:G-type lectin S-receptor-like serine/threonine-protein kinase LECRK3 [Camellia lanceoleosa]|uniref:G-type lectin S-receptor-like serine/threonine-protein kinase LECRK3 n=1 Tax=Camellia lanceoleosa TaxID=1840588 RepID=A0ACC0FGX1_9ERIC|nr:G-type lectin S-receptor-like serine/threonine-protein kinase LECRK3 [Camellia lanceoleosa]
MAVAILIFFLIILSSTFLHTITIEAQQQRNSSISLGSSLTPTTNSSWLSRSGLYAFGFYPEGNGYAVGVFLSGIPENTIVWTANRDKTPVPSNATLAFTSDGSLILQQPQSQDVTYIADISQPAFEASMLDSGNFVLYDSNHNVIWQSFRLPTDTILSGQPLLAGLDLFSSVSGTNHSTGIFRLVMQRDGNLVQYPASAIESRYAYWASNTSGNGDNCSLNLDGDGHLYLLNATGTNISNLTKGEPPTKEKKIYMMKIDVDGIFRVYSRILDPNGKWSILWPSSDDHCHPLGLCGLNGFCVLNDNIADCKCVPGFVHVNPISWASGCLRNFTTESCKTIDGEGNSRYNISPLENTVWDDDSYMVLQLNSRKECEDACLQDCSCEAALYKDGQCRKQRFPLRFGRRLVDDSNVALIKVGNYSSPNTKGVPTDSDHKPKKKLRLDILIIGVSLIAIALMVLAISSVLMYRNHVWVYKKISEKGNAVELGEDAVLRTFTFKELEQVTNGFNEELGRGASGTVFKGFISYNQKDVAVKRLEKLLIEDWSLAEEEAVLEEWVYDCFQAKELHKLLVYKEEVEKKKLERVVKVGLWCIQGHSYLNELVSGAQGRIEEHGGEGAVVGGGLAVMVVEWSGVGLGFGRL